MYLEILKIKIIFPYNAIEIFNLAQTWTRTSDRPSALAEGERGRLLEKFAIHFSIRGAKLTKKRVHIVTFDSFVIHLI